MDALEIALSKSTIDEATRGRGAFRPVVGPGA